MRGLGLAVLAVGAMLAVPAMAQQKCSYSPLQEVVRGANSAQDVTNLVQRRVNLNTPVRCGGSIIALAVLRGNTDVLKVLIENGADIKSKINIRELGISGNDLPQDMSVQMFAALKAPNIDVFKVIVNAANDLTEVDKKGENLLWYLDQNPVLRRTPIVTQVEEAILYQSAMTETEGATDAAGAAGTPNTAAPKEVVDTPLNKGSF